MENVGALHRKSESFNKEEQLMLEKLCYGTLKFQQLLAMKNYLHDV